MRTPVSQSLRNSARHPWSSMRVLLIAALLFSTRAAESQSTPVSRPPGPSPAPGTAIEISAEEIYKRFASRILLLTCDLSANEVRQASGVLVSADGFVATNAHVVEGCRGMTAT